MDLLVIIVNDYKSRKAVKAYLKDVGLGEFIVMESSGTSSITRSSDQYITMKDLPFDSISNNEEKGKTIFVINKNDDKTEEYLDEIAKHFKQEAKKRNSGLVFSVPVGEFFPKK